MKFRPIFIVILMFLFSFILSGCQKGALFTQPTLTSQPPTITSTFVPTVTQTPTITPTFTPEPTATPVLLTVSAGTVQVPILLYHHITADPEKSDTRYNVPPEDFKQQMQWLFDNGYQTLTVTQLTNLIRNGGQIPQRPMIITFDDGNLNVFETAYPIMQEYGFFGTFYIVENYLNSQQMVNTDQVLQLIQDGWEIGLHSRTHSNLTGAGVDLADEIRLAKLDMEKILGVTINSFAYPFGAINQDVIRLTYSYGFTSGVGLGISTFHSTNSIYYLERIEIQNEYDMQKFISLMPWSGPLQ